MISLAFSLCKRCLYCRLHQTDAILLCCFFSSTFTFFYAIYWFVHEICMWYLRDLFISVSITELIGFIHPLMEGKKVMFICSPLFCRYTIRTLHARRRILVKGWTYKALNEAILRTNAKLLLLSYSEIPYALWVTMMETIYHDIFGTD